MPRRSSTRARRSTSPPTRAAPGLNTVFATYGRSAVVRMGLAGSRLNSSGPPRAASRRRCDLANAGTVGSSRRAGIDAAPHRPDPLERDEPHQRRLGTLVRIGAGPGQAVLAGPVGRAARRHSDRRSGRGTRRRPTPSSSGDAARRSPRRRPRRRAAGRSLPSVADRTARGARLVATSRRSRSARSGLPGRSGPPTSQASRSSPRSDRGRVTEPRTCDDQRPRHQPVLVGQDRFRPRPGAIGPVERAPSPAGTRRAGVAARRSRRHCRSRRATVAGEQSPPPEAEGKSSCTVAGSARSKSAAAAARNAGSPAPAAAWRSASAARAWASSDPIVSSHVAVDRPEVPEPAAPGLKAASRKRNERPAVPATTGQPSSAPWSRSTCRARATSSVQ